MFKKLQLYITDFIKSSFAKKLLGVCKFLFAAVLIYFLTDSCGVKLQHFEQLKWHYVASAGGVLLLQNFFVALRWWWLLRAFKVEASFFTALSLTMQGLFCMLFLPGGTVAADLCKAALSAGASAAGQKFDAAFTVLLDRVCGLAGLLMLSFFAAFYYISWAPYHLVGEISYLLKGVMIGSPVLLVIIYGAFHADKLLKIPLLQRLYDWCNSWSKDFFKQIVESLCICRSAKKQVIGCMLFSALVTFPLIILCIYFIGRSFAGSGDSVFYGAILSGSAGELAGLLPLTPGSIGVRDVIFLKCFQACGLGNESAALIPLIFTALLFITGSTGALFMLSMLWKKNSRSAKDQSV